MQNREQPGPTAIPNFHRWQSVLVAGVDLRDFPNWPVSSASCPPANDTFHSAGERNLFSSAEHWLVADIEALRKTIKLDPFDLPKWASDLLVLISFLERPRNESLQSPVQVRPREHQFVYLPLCIPVVRFAVTQLADVCSCGLMEQLSPAAHHKLRSLLATRLLRAIRPSAKTLLDEMESSQTPGSGSGHSRVVEESGIVCDFFQPSAEFRLLCMFQRFPALARLMSELASDWTDSSRELLQRLQQDKRRLIRTFGKRMPRGKEKIPFVRNLRAALGDPHRHGRSVTALSLQGGGRVVYKPRDCRGEWEWHHAFRQVRDKSLRPIAPKVILREGWGWVEFVSVRSCRNIRSVRNFYRRAGAVVCMAHLLRAADLHRGNLIAAGAHPVVVDLETLWSPQTDRTEDEPLALTSLLPSAVADGSIHWSAFGSPSAEEIDDDADHRPRLSGENFRAADFISEIEGGFCDIAVELLQSARQRRRLSVQRNRIAQWSWRRVFWSTEAYAAVQEDSVKPTLLKDGLTRFRAIVDACKGRGTRPDIVLHEAAALTRLDIPYFKSDANVASATRSTRPPCLRDVLHKLPELRSTLLAVTVFSGLSRARFDTALSAPPSPVDT